MIRAHGRRQRSLVGMNKLETAYSEHLEWLKREGTVAYWHREPFNVRLAGKTYWKPDFWVIKADGAIEVHEVKGYWEDHSKIRIKVAAEKYPWLPIYMVRRKPKKDGGGWDIQPVGPFEDKHDTD